MTEQKNHAGPLETGKSRAPFVAGIAVLTVGFVFCRSFSVSGSEAAGGSMLAQRSVDSAKSVRTAATHEAGGHFNARSAQAGGSDLHHGQTQIHTEIPPRVILQPHPPIRQLPIVHQPSSLPQQAGTLPHANMHSSVQSHALGRPTSQILTQPGLPQSHQARPQPTGKPTEQEKGSFIQLVDESGKPVMPSAVVSQAGKFYFLGPKHLWSLEWTQPAASDNRTTRTDAARRAYLKACHPPAAIDKIPVQEFNNMISVPPRKSLVILSKAGDLFEYFTESGAWHQYRANLWLTGSPDPDYVDLAFNGKDIILIDPERNDIWVCPPASRYLTPYFREVMPWAVRRGDYYVGDGIALAYDGFTYLLRKNGAISKFAGNSKASVRQLKMPFHAPGRARMRPSRLVTAAGCPLYIVERENNRVVSIDKKSGQTHQFVFSKTSDLRGLAPVKDGFAVVNGDRLVTRRIDTADPPGAEIHPRSFDQRLDGIGIPVPGGQLPAHLGVFPGARRLYRYGIHAGVDFFNGGGNKVVMGTPAIAADRGKIIRIDRNYSDMDAATFNRVMSQCAREHNTSERNEDLFRGCQVWIDHGNRMVTRYAHLSKINASLKRDSFVNRGDTVGYIGVSGTGQNLPGKAKYPHLHFEIWLDGHYVGYGLTPGETLGVYEDIFGTGR